MSIPFSPIWNTNKVDSWLSKLKWSRIGFLLTNESPLFSVPSNGTFPSSLSIRRASLWLDSVPQTIPSQKSKKKSRSCSKTSSWALLLLGASLWFEEVEPRDMSLYPKYDGWSSKIFPRWTQTWDSVGIDGKVIWFMFFTFLHSFNHLIIFVQETLYFKKPTPWKSDHK